MLWVSQPNTAAGHYAGIVTGRLENNVEPLYNVSVAVVHILSNKFGTVSN